MKPLLITLLFVVITTFAGCKNGIFGEKKCSRDGWRNNYGWLEFFVYDETGTLDYFSVHQELDVSNFSVYDENWNFATFNGSSWQYNSRIPELPTIDFTKYDEPFGIDRVKIFYLKFDKDIDTLQVKYKMGNECMQADYIKVFYNQKMIFEDYTKERQPSYNFKIKKK